MLHSDNILSGKKLNHLETYLFYEDEFYTDLIFNYKHPM